MLEFLIKKSSKIPSKNLCSADIAKATMEPFVDTKVSDDNSNHTLCIGSPGSVDQPCLDLN